jgi:inosine-uridine nucleoside N-ribohydrolase
MLGVPVPNQQWENDMYSKQGEAYEDQLDAVSPDSTDVASILQAIASAVEEARHHDKMLNIVSIGPLSNIAAFIAAFPNLVPYINIWHMGGWFSNDVGSLKRSGYNSGINPSASQLVFTSDARVFVVSSDIVQRTNIEIDKETTWRELTKINQVSDSDWVKAIKRDWVNWNAAFLPIRFADVLTTYLELHPENITKLIQYDVKYQFHLDHTHYGDEGFMKTDPPILSIEPSKDANVFVVMGYKGPKKALSSILGVVHHVLKQ